MAEMSVDENTGPHSVSSKEMFKVVWYDSMLSYSLLHLLMRKLRKQH